MPSLPRILVIDDLFGRAVLGRRNEERANLCGQYLLEDVTGDEAGLGTPQHIKRPVAQAVFARGQTPVRAALGDIVENDLLGTLEVIRTGWREWPRWSLVLLDLCFYTGRVTPPSNAATPGMPEGRPADEHLERYFGLTLLRAIRAEFSKLPVAIMSSMPREEVSRTIYDLGAMTFLARSEGRGADRLRDHLNRHGLLEDPAEELVGHSVGLLEAMRGARRAPDRGHVLLLGERGTGKELLAQYMYRQRPESGRGPFIAVDAGALSPTLFASELFGHVKGSFTGATHDRLGGLVRAHGGDLFLDEVGNLPLEVQKGLMRVLEQREVYPVGASEPVKVNVRVIAATNEDLEARVVAGEFKQDLYDRLREGGEITLPPLRDRPEDLEPLVTKFLRSAEAAVGSASRRSLEPATLAALRAYDWPGNVRELRNRVMAGVRNYPDVEHLVPFHLGLPAPTAPTPAIAAADLDAFLQVSRQLDPQQWPAADLVGALPRVWDKFARVLVELLKASLRETARATPEAPEGQIQIHPAMKLLTGDSGLTASRAADLIKRCLALAPDVLSEALTDPRIRHAYETALRLRPRGLSKSSRPKPG